MASNKKLREIALKEPLKTSEDHRSDRCNDLQIPASPLAQVFQCKSREDDADVIIYAVMDFEYIVDLDALIFLLEEKILSIPRFRSVLVKSGSNYSWKRVENVNVKDHIYEATLDNLTSATDGGNQIEQIEYANNLLNKPINLLLPHWEIHVLHSPGKGDTIIFRIHHSIGDGVSLASLLLDIAEKKDGKPILLPQPRKNPNPSSLSIFLKPFSYFWNTMIGVIQFFSVLFFADPKSTVKVTESVRHLPREISLLKFPVSEVKHIGSTFGATVNDVMVATVAAALEKYDICTSKSLRDSISLSRKCYKPKSLVMVNLRPPLSSSDIQGIREGKDSPNWGTIVGYTMQPLPVSGVSSPLKRVEIVSNSMKRAKYSAEALISNLGMQFIGKFFGPIALLRFLLFITGQVTTGVSNVASPEEIVQLAGNPVKSLFQFVSGVPMGVSFHIIGYSGNVFITINACKGIVDPRVMSKCLKGAFEDLKNSI